MRRLLRLLLIAATCSLTLAVPAHAEPISLFFAGISQGMALGGATIAGGAVGAFGAGVAAGQFLAMRIFKK